MKEPVFRGIGRNQPLQDWRFGAHSHTNCEVIIINEGSEKVETKLGTFVAVPGDILFFKPGVVHREWSMPGKKLDTFFFLFDFNPPEKWPLRVKDARGRGWMIAEWIYEERYSGSNYSNAAVNSFLTSFLAEFARLVSHVENEMVDAVRQKIRAHLGEEITLDRLAGWAGLSKFHFVRTYSQLSGRTPARDLQLIRASHARDLILTTSLPLKQIAIMSGLSDIVTLSRAFRKSFGASPGSMRNRRKGVEVQ